MPAQIAAVGCYLTAILLLLLVPVAQTARPLQAGGAVFSFAKAGGSKAMLGTATLERALRNHQDSYKTVDELAKRLDEDDDLVSGCWWHCDIGIGPALRASGCTPGRQQNANPPSARGFSIHTCVYAASLWFVLSGFGCGAWEANLPVRRPAATSTWCYTTTTCTKAASVGN